MAGLIWTDSCYCIKKAPIGGGAQIRVISADMVIRSFIIPFFSLFEKKGCRMRAEVKGIETVKDLLIRPRETRQVISDLLDRKQQLEGRLRMRSATYEGKVRTSKVDLIGEIMTELTDLEAELQKCMVEYQHASCCALSSIHRLSNPTEQTVLVLYYVSGLSMEEVAAKMERSIRKLYNYKNDGIKHLADLLNS